MDESIALEKGFQNKFVKKVKKVKKRVQTNEPVQENTIKPPKSKHGFVYVGHIPHGFYEKEMLAYFKQFGKISNLRLCRSDKTGRSKGYAFIEFAEAEVAKIAASTMNNYLMFNRRLEAKYIDAEQSQRLGKYKLPSWSVNSYPLKLSRKKTNLEKNKNVDEATHLKRSKKLLSTVNKSLQKLKGLGIDYSFQAVDIPNELIENNQKITRKNKPKDKVNSESKTQEAKQKNGIKSNLKVLKRKKKNIPRKK